MKSFQIIVMSILVLKTEKGTGNVIEDDSVLPKWLYFATDSNQNGKVVGLYRRKNTRPPEYEHWEQKGVKIRNIYTWTVTENGVTRYTNPNEAEVPPLKGWMDNTGTDQSVALHFYRADLEDPPTNVKLEKMGRNLQST